MNIVIKDGGNALKISKNTANITLEWFNSNGTESELKALAILLGAYNRYGRKINLDVHRERVAKFRELLEETAADL